MNFTKIIAFVLLYGYLIQYVEKAFVFIDFFSNQEYIAKNECENRFKTELQCKGSCVLAKRVKEVEKHESKTPNTLKVQEKPNFYQDYSIKLQLPYAVVLNKKINNFILFHFQSFFLSIFHPPD
jgi:hypothetical protein